MIYHHHMLHMLKKPNKISLTKYKKKGIINREFMVPDNITGKWLKSKRKVHQNFTDFLDKSN